VIRTAFQLVLVPEETVADLEIYYRANKRELLKYAINVKTFRESALTLKKPENIKLVEKLNQPYITYGNRKFIAMMKGSEPGNTMQRRNFIKRLFNFKDNKMMNS